MAGNRLDEERKGEIAFALLKSLVKNKILSEDRLQRHIPDFLKTAKIPRLELEDFMSEFWSEIFGEIIDERYKQA